MKKALFAEKILAKKHKIILILCFFYYFCKIQILIEIMTEKHYN